MYIKYGSLYIYVDGDRVTYTQEYDPDYKNNEKGTAMIILEPHNLSRTYSSFHINADCGRVTHTWEYDPDPQNQTGKPCFSGIHRIFIIPTQQR